ncbi:MAG TPA: hypothetical protein VMT44_00470, partial [Methanoregula sp.]|nr:hypothetical protein [Methanoregula sp.]
SLDGTAHWSILRHIAYLKSGIATPANDSPVILEGKAEYSTRRNCVNVEFNGIELIIEIFESWNPEVLFETMEFDKHPMSKNN